MKLKAITICLVAVTCFACSFENGDDGTSRGTAGFDTLTIDYENDNQNWTEIYSYVDGKLIRVEDDRVQGNLYEHEYQDEKLLTIHLYQTEDNDLTSMDSLIYNPSGTIKSIETYTSYPGPELTLNWISEYEYNDKGKVTQMSRYYERTEEYVSTEKYSWSGENIEKMERYDEEGELMHEFFYDYDDKKNYQINFPIFISDPIYWSANNVTNMEYIDHTGLLDMACGPCSNSYNYDTQGRPSQIETNWGLTMQLSYQ